MYLLYISFVFGSVDYANLKCAKTTENAFEKYHFGVKVCNFDLIIACIVNFIVLHVKVRTRKVFVVLYIVSLIRTINRKITWLRGFR